MSKTTYQNLVAIPGASDDVIHDGLNIGGDVTTNFKALADAIHPNKKGGFVVGGDNRDLTSVYLYNSDSWEAFGHCALNNNAFGYASSSGPWRRPPAPKPFTASGRAPS